MSIPAGIPQLSDPSMLYCRTIHIHTGGKPADSAEFPPSPPRAHLYLRAGHIVLDGFPALREMGTAPPPPLGPCLLWPRSPISAIAELLFKY